MLKYVENPKNHGIWLGRLSCCGNASPCRDNTSSCRGDNFHSNPPQLQTTITSSFQLNFRRCLYAQKGIDKPHNPI